jgi:maltose alpha-D-glucosyltransferase/alpha-amylase
MNADDPLWYKDAIIYELHVRAFHDSDGDGFGDFRGLTQKLDYLVDLGVTAVWLLPFYPSPLKDDGYDIADYTSIHPRYGRLADFKEFLEEAHKRELRVITELVINHTSDQHPWFQRARRSPPGSPERDFYVWSDTPEKYKDARIIFKDFEPSNWSWDPVAKSYYWHRFYSHQPDLNFDNQAVWQALFPILDFWMGMGVDGMRLDAIPYLFEREGTNCENLPETHEFLKALRRHMDSRHPGKMFLAEANQWPEDAAAYFGNGDECHMAFHFPVMPRLFMALHQEDRFPILDILSQTPAIPDNCQWCMFLRNHDELTLEMVTDEERDYMYRAYAEDRTARINLGIRHRLGPLLKNDRRRIELMKALLFSLPGTPVLYYGDEIGMGDNIYLGDRNGVRTPMQWSSDRNAGFSRANPQRLYLPVIIDPEYHYEAFNVEAQQNNPSSLLWWMKRLIALRKRFKAFGRGTIEFLRPANPKVLAFIRRYRDERVLVVANLSRFVQHVEIDLREFRGLAPVELYGRSAFPPISDAPYPIMLGPHGFCWFSLEVRETQPLEIADKPVLIDVPTTPRSWPALLREENRDELEALLPAYIENRQFFDRDTRISAAHCEEIVTMNADGVSVWMLFVRVEQTSGLHETINLPVALVAEDQVDSLLAPLGSVGLVRVGGEQPGIIADALALPQCCWAIVKAIAGSRARLIGTGELVATTLPTSHSIETAFDDGKPMLRQSDHGNLCVFFGERLVLKAFRRLEGGTSPALETGRFLTERGFAHVPPLLGYVEYHRRGGEPGTLAVLHSRVPAQSDALQLTLDQLSSFFERVAALSREQAPPVPEILPLIGATENEGAPVPWRDLIGGFLDIARLMGERTADLHRALASESVDPAFSPEPFGRLYQRSIYQSMRNLTGRTMTRLDRAAWSVPKLIRPLATRLLESQNALLQRFRTVLDSSIGGYRIRCHGSYHLERLLWTGRDFAIIHFEGDLTRALGERRIKRSPLRDVAAMVRSFDYAVQGMLLGLAGSRGRAPGVIRPEDRQVLQPWAGVWHNRVAREFIASYLTHMRDAGILPPTVEQCRNLLELFLLEHALHETEFELLHRPEWVGIPIAGALRNLGAPANDEEIAL